MNDMDRITLQHYQPHYLEELKSFELPKNQEQFTAMPSDILHVKPGQHPIVILNENHVVGFFLLHNSERVKEYSSNSQAMLLTALSINHREQGKGYALKGMNALRSFVTEEFPQCNEIVLAVNYKNFAAQKLYAKVGFIDTGRRKTGLIGEQYIMSLSL